MKSFSDINGCKCLYFSGIGKIFIDLLDFHLIFIWLGFIYCRLSSYNSHINKLAIYGSGDVPITFSDLFWPINFQRPWHNRLYGSLTLHNSISEIRHLFNLDVWCGPVNIPALLKNFLLEVLMIFSGGEFHLTLVILRNVTTRLILLDNFCPIVFL